MKKGCSKAVVGVVLLASGVWAWMRFSVPDLDSTPLATLPVQEQERRRADASRLEKELHEIEEAAKAHQKKPFQLEVTDEQLNTLLQDRADTERFPVRNLRVRFVPDRVLAQGDVSYNGLEASAMLEGAVQLEKGRLSYSTTSLRISGLPAPSNLKDKVDTQVGEKLQSALGRAPVRLEKVEIQKGKMIVSGQTD